MRLTLVCCLLYFICLHIPRVVSQWPAYTSVPNCPLEPHPLDERMFIMRGPTGKPHPKVCPTETTFIQSMCSCVSRPPKCTLRPSQVGPQYYEEYLFGQWTMRPCGPGSAFNPITCDCSVFY
ncbi:hypothetical protein CHS0354_023224 [Potamilus streckersoni]|uniref:Uncharacterized protein n=1 Tax=Potamilus streckersoni TaxID=2493646 RepID=A0AAE0VWX9_9BIVA|nr:hypothetical protein CHS0354_023224 [Potamilus streckersoni]